MVDLDKNASDEPEATLVEEAGHGRLETTAAETPTRPLVIAAAALAVLLIAAITVYVVIGDPEPPPTASSSQGEPVTPARADTETGYAPGALPIDDRAAVEAAVEALPLALSYDFRTLDDGLEKAVALMTDDFAAEFRRTFAATAAEQAETKDAVTDASVRAAGVVRVEDGGKRILCLVYVDQVLVSSDTTRNEDQPLQVSLNRVLVGLTDTDGAWKVDSITPI